MKNITLFLALIFGLFYPTSHANSPTPNQCYPDAQSAYNALMTKQQMTAYAENNFVININTAHPSELISLKGVGVKTAEAIVAYRETVGEFTTVDELTNVKGIGQKTVDNNRHRLTVR